MKVSMMTYTLARGDWGDEPDIEKLCQFTRELGLDAVDWITTYGHDPAYIRQITDDFGLDNICYTFFATLQHPSKEERAKGLEDVKKGLEVASILGADTVMIPLSGNEDTPRSETRKYAIEGLARAVELGEEMGITVTIEHFPAANSPFITSSDVNEALEAVPDLRITYDNGNVYTGGEDPVDGYLNSKEYIVHAHFKDWVAGEEGRLGADGRRYQAALVGEGDVDPEPCIRVMKDNNYKGHINFEYEGDCYDPWEATRKGVRLLKDLIAEV